MENKQTIGNKETIENKETIGNKEPYDEFYTLYSLLGRGYPSEDELRQMFLLNKATATKLLEHLNGFIKSSRASEWDYNSVYGVNYYLDNCYDFVRSLFGPEECIDVSARRSPDYESKVRSGKFDPLQKYLMIGDNEQKIDGIFFTIGNGTLIELEFRPLEKRCAIWYCCFNQNINISFNSTFGTVSFYGDNQNKLVDMYRLKSTTNRFDDHNIKPLDEVLRSISIDELLTRVQNLEYTPPAKHK